MNNELVLLTDVSYGAHERQKADIFIPQAPKSNAGLILFIHGGGWKEGDKQVHHPDAQYFCEHGYITACLNYRYVSDEITVFEELDDIASALHAIRSKCLEFDYCLDKVILSGGSAGSNLALLYAYSRRNSASVQPVAVCAYCPPVDCTRDDFLLGISGEFEDWKFGILSECCGVRITKDELMNDVQQNALKKMSPAHYVSSDCIPTAVFHGKRDEIIPVSHVMDFTELLKSFGIRNDLLIYENSGHALDKDEETAIKAKTVILEYAKEYL